MSQSEELERRFPGLGFHVAVGCGVGVVVHACVLVVQCGIQHVSAQAGLVKHALDEWLELHKAVVELIRDRSLQLDLVCLETVTS